MEQETHIIDWEATRIAAVALGIDVTTLPTGTGPADVVTTKRALIPVIEPLSDAEWLVIAEALPALPVPKPGVDYNDRQFIESVLWHVNARGKGYNWAAMPGGYGPVASRKHRHYRWCMLGYWQALAEKLREGERLAPGRLMLFERIADDAERRRIKVEADRKRLNGAGG